MKFDWIERLMSGSSKVVIENGVINQKNLRAMRMTVDQLEMRLRQNAIVSIDDVKTATLEPNGQVGFELKPHARPVTVGDMERLLGLKLDASQQQPVLFQEVKQQQYPKPIDPRLQ